MNVNAQLTLFSNLFNSKTLRERLLILICVLVAITLIWFYVFAAPVNAKRAQLEQRFTAAKATLAQLSAEEQVYVQALSNDPNVEKQHQLMNLNEKLDSLDRELQSLSVGLLPVNLLPRVLHDVLERSASLTLLNFKNEQAKALFFQNVEAIEIQPDLEDIDTHADGALSPQSVDVFKHAVVVQLEGSYFQVRDFLDNMEALPWKFYWESLDYRVLQYPRARVTIELYTLTTEKGFLGG